MPPFAPHAITLPDGILEDWRRAVLTWGRPGKGIPKSAPEDERMHYIIKAAQNELLTLWETYNTDREAMGRLPLSQRSTILAYLIGFHLPGSARMSLVWKRLTERFDLGPLQTGKWVFQDIGCGTGAMSHTLRHLVEHKDTLWHLSDARGGFLDAANLVIGEAENVKTHRSTIEALKPEYFRLREGETGFYLAGYVWNELQKNPKARRTFMNVILGPLKRDESQFTIILEPANERPARLAMQLRDELTAAGLVPVYPCPHSQGCPLVEKPKDRCYTDGGWNRPPEVKQLDRILGTDRTRIATAAYIFATPRAAESIRPRRKMRAVTIGIPTIGPNVGPSTKRIRLLCTPEGQISRQDYFPGHPKDRGLPMDS